MCTGGMRSMGKDRPNKLVRDYGRPTKAGVVLVKKRNPTLTTSQWKKRAMGLYGTRLVFSEVGHEDQVREDDEVTEDLQLMRAASVEINTVLGVACVIVQTATKSPLVFRPQDESQSYLLGEWAKAIKTAVMPPTPGTVDPLVELQALMRRKDLTAAEAQRAQMLMRQGGAAGTRARPARSTQQPQQQQTMTNDSTLPMRQAHLPPGSASMPPSSSWAVPPGDGRALFGGGGGGGAQTSQPPAMLASPPKGIDDDPFAALSFETTTPPVSSSSLYGSSSGSSPAGASFAAPPNPFAAPPPSRPPPQQAFAAAPPPIVTKSVMADPFAAVAAAPPRNNQPPAVSMLTAVHDGDGEYYGYIAPNGTCYDAEGVCVGYLNDRERTAGSSRGEYLGCVSEPRRGEAMIETPDGSPLARIDLGHAKVVTLAGSTVAQFKVDGNVVADLGHAVCCFDKLSLRDQPTMALYLSFIAPDLLKTAANKVHGGPPPSSSLQNDAYNNGSGSAFSATQQHAPPVRVLPPVPPRRADQDLPRAVASTPAAPPPPPRDVFAEMPAPQTISQAPPPPPARDVVGRVAAPPRTDAFDAPPAGPPPPPPRAQQTHRTVGVVDEPLPAQPPPPPRRSEPASDSPPAGPPPPPPPRSNSDAPVEQLTENIRDATIQDAPKDLPAYVAIADFVAESPDWQVSVSQGTSCVLVEDHGDGWSSIIVEGGQQGAVPSAFIESAASGATATAAQGANAAPTEKLYTVAHSFQAQDPTWQVDVQQDEMVSLCQEFDDGWSEIAKADGTRGLVPSGFLRG